MRAIRFDIDDRRMVVHRSMFAAHLADGRQLQHRCSLSRTKVGEQDDPAVRKLEGIMVRRRMLRVHLTEAGEPSAGLPLLEKAKEWPTPLDVIFERQFSARQKADRYRWRIVGREAASGGAWKARCYQVVAGLSRSR
jgi:hypothetical protein